MSKRFKLLVKAGKIHILHWEGAGLFGPQWEGIASFDDRDGNRERSRRIIQLLNECDNHTNHPEENDSE